MDSLEVVRDTLGPEKSGEFYLMATGRITAGPKENASEESVNLAFAEALHYFHQSNRLPLNGGMTMEFAGDLRRKFGETLAQKHKQCRSLQDVFLKPEVEILSKLYKTAAKEELRII